MKAVLASLRMRGRCWLPVILDPMTTSQDASSLYARNIQALIKLINNKGELKLDLEDEIIAGALLTTDGAVRHAPTAEAVKALG